MPTFVLFVILAACGGDGAAVKACANPVSTTTVEMVKLTFVPDCLSVDTGATITLRNTSNMPRTFTVDGTDINFNVRPAESVEAKLSDLSAGLYAVKRSFHPTMDATLKVE